MDDDSEVIAATQILDATQKLESSVDSESTSEYQQCGILQVGEQKHAVFTGDTVIGRGQACQIVLESGTVSTRHAVIEATTNVATIHDVDSSNGTTKGLIKLRPNIRYELKDGDELKFGNIVASWTTQIDEVADALDTSNLSQSLFDNDETEYGTPMGPSRTPAPPDRFGTPRDFVPETPCVPAKAFNTSDLCFAPASQSSPLPSRDVFKIPESPGDCLDDSSFICASQQPEVLRPLRPQTSSQLTITKVGTEDAAAPAVVSVADSDEEIDITLAPPAHDVDEILEAETQALAVVPKASSHDFDLETQPVVDSTKTSTSDILDSGADVFEAETQAVGVGVFDANRQAEYSSETDDLLAAATQAVPQEEAEAEDMFAMCTQAVVPDRERERGVSESDLMEAETQAVVHNDDDNIMSDSELFGAATQAPPSLANDSELMGAPLKVPIRSFRESMSDSQLMGAPTQKISTNKMNDSVMFEAATQPVFPSMSDSHLMGAPTQCLASNKLNDSEIFGAATQAIAPVTSGAPTQPTASNKLDDSEIYGAATQAVQAVDGTEMLEDTTQSVTTDSPANAQPQMVADATNDSVFENETQTVSLEMKESIFTEETQAVKSAKIDEDFTSAQTVESKQVAEDEDIFMGATQAIPSDTMDQHILTAETQAIETETVDDNLDSDSKTNDLDTSKDSDILDSNAYLESKNEHQKDMIQENEGTQLKPDEERKADLIQENEGTQLKSDEDQGQDIETNDANISNDSEILDSNNDLEHEKENEEIQHKLDVDQTQDSKTNDADTNKDTQILDSNNDLEPPKEKNYSDTDLEPNKIKHYSDTNLEPEKEKNNSDTDFESKKENCPSVIEKQSKDAEEVVNDLDKTNVSDFPGSNNDLQLDQVIGSDENQGNTADAIESVQDEKLLTEVKKTETKENIQSNELDNSNDSEILDLNDDSLQEEPDKEIFFQSETKDHMSEEQSDLLIADTQAMEPMEDFSHKEVTQDDLETEQKDTQINVLDDINKDETIDEDMFLMATQAPQLQEKIEVPDDTSAMETDAQVPDTIEVPKQMQNLNGHQVTAIDNLSDISEDSVEGEKNIDKDCDRLSDISDDLLMENTENKDVEGAIVAPCEAKVTGNGHDLESKVSEESSASKNKDEVNLDDTTDEVSVDDKTDIKSARKENLHKEDVNMDDADDSIVLSSQVSDPMRLSKTNYDSVTMVKDDSVIASSQPTAPQKKLSDTTYGTINMDQTDVVESPIVSTKEDALDVLTTAETVPNVDQELSKVIESSESASSPIFISKKRSMSQSLSQSRMEDSSRKSISDEKDQKEKSCFEAKNEQEEFEESFASNVSVTRRSKSTYGFDKDASVTVAVDKMPEEVIENPEEEEEEETIESHSDSDSVPVLPMTQTLIGSNAEIDSDNEKEAVEAKSQGANEVNKMDVISVEVAPVPVIQKTPTLEVKSVTSQESTSCNSQDEAVDMGRGRRKRKPTAVMELSLEQEKEVEEEKEANNPKKRRSSKLTPPTLMAEIDHPVNGGTPSNVIQKDDNLTKDNENDDIADTQPWTGSNKDDHHDDIADTQPWTGTDLPEDSEEVLDDTQPLVIDELKSKRVRKSTAKILEMEATQKASAIKVKTPIIEKKTKKSVLMKTKTPGTEKVTTPDVEKIKNKTTEKTPETPIVEKIKVAEKTKTLLPGKTPQMLKASPTVKSLARTEPDNGSEEDQSKSKRIRKATPKMLEIEASKTPVTSGKTPATSSKTTVAPKRLVLASRASKSPVIAVTTPVIVANSSIVSKTQSPSKRPIVKESPTLNKSGRKSGLENKPQVKTAQKRGASVVAPEKDTESPTKKIKPELKPQVKTDAQGGNNKLSLSRRGGNRKLALPTSSLIDEPEQVPAVAPKGRGRKSDIKPIEPEVTIPEPPPTPAQRRGKGKKLAMPNSLLMDTPETVEKSAAVPSPVSLPTPAGKPVKETARGRRGRAAAAAPEPQPTKTAAAKGRRGRQSAPAEPQSVTAEPIKSAPAVRGKRGRQSTPVEVPEPSITEEPEVELKGRRGRTSVIPDAKQVEPVKRGSKAATVENVEPEKDQSKEESAVKGRRGKKQVETLQQVQSTDSDAEPVVKGRRGRPSKLHEQELEKEPEPAQVTIRKGRGRMSQIIECQADIIDPTTSKRGGKAVENKVTEDISKNKGRSRAGKRKQDDDAEHTSKKIKTDSKPASRKGTSEIETPVASPLLRGVSVESYGRSLSPSLRRGSARSRHKVMFTGIAPDKKDNEMVAELGGELTELCSETTVLVTDQIKRTEKLLCAVARGVPVVSSSWLHQSKKSGSFLDPWQFIIQDTEKEKQWEFNLLKTLQSAKKQPLLKGLIIHVTKKVKPPPELFQQVIESGGGVYLKSLPKQFEEGLLVISCTEDKSSHSKLKKAGIPILDKEFILTGLFQRKLDYEFVV